MNSPEATLVLEIHRGKRSYILSSGNPGFTYNREIDESQSEDTLRTLLKLATESNLAMIFSRVIFRFFDERINLTPLEDINPFDESELVVPVTATPDLPRYQFHIPNVNPGPREQRKQDVNLDLAASLDGFYQAIYNISLNLNKKATAVDLEFVNDPEAA